MLKKLLLLIIVIVAIILIGLFYIGYTKSTPSVWETSSGQLACDFLLKKDALEKILPIILPGYQTPAPLSIYEIPGQLSVGAVYMQLANDGTADKKIEIKITNFCDDPSVAWNGEGSIYQSSNHQTETVEAIMLSGNKALKTHYLVFEDSYKYVILVGEHILIYVTGTDGVSDNDVYAAANSINYSRLNQLLSQ